LPASPGGPSRLPASPGGPSRLPASLGGPSRLPASPGGPWPSSRRGPGIGRHPSQGHHSQSHLYPGITS
jgi:hypothetical protein